MLTSSEDKEIWCIGFWLLIFISLDNIFCRFTYSRDITYVIYVSAYSWKKKIRIFWIWIKIIFKISFVSSSLLKSLFSALIMNCWPIVKIIWYFVVCRWFWHFYCSGLLIHSALLTVMVYSVFVADKFPEEVSLFLGYIRIPASESGILRNNVLKHMGPSYSFRWLHIYTQK